MNRTIKRMKVLGVVLPLLLFGESLGVQVFLKKKYPNVENGVYQIDRKGAPIKIVDVNYGHVWEIPKSEKGVDEYAVIPKKGGVRAFSKGTNLVYGTTQKIGIKSKEEEEGKIQPQDVKKEIKKNKKKGIIKNLVSVNKKEKKESPKAMYIDADEIPEEKKEKEKETEAEEGKELGEMIKENIERHYEVTKEPSHLSIDLLNQEIPKSIEEMLNEDLEEQRWLVQKPVEDKICLRDYTKQCPSTWEAISEKQCRSPKNYKGPCAHIMAFEPMTAKEKSQLAIECRVNWSCLNETCGNNERDYSQDCPLGWKYTGKCEAPEHYTGGCDRVMDFGAFTQNEKEEFSSSCKAVWPCKDESCERDYSITCPKGWGYNVSKDVCIATKEYEELCSPEEIASISHMSYYQRMEFSTHYGISWPCKRKCTYGYEEFDCPRGWVNLMNSGICKAPDSYVAPSHCPTMTHFDYMSSQEKEDFSKKCNVKWTCLENAQRDYTQCPVHFDLITQGSDKGKCKPTEFYQGPCKQTQNILGLSLEQKINFEETCEALFPNLENGELQNYEQDTIPQKKLQKLLKGADLTNKGITLE